MTKISSYALTILAALCFANPSSAQLLYWTDWRDKAIKRMNVDGADVQTILPLSGQPSGLAVDYDSQTIFWSMWTGANAGNILSANLDGSNLSVVSTTGALQVWNIAIDSNTIYFNSFGNVGSTGVGKVQRTGADLTFFENSEYGEALTFDPRTSSIYYQLQTSNDAIFKRDCLGVSPPQQLLDASADYEDFVAGIAIDYANDHMYFTDSNGPGHRIMRAHLDGSGLELVADVPGTGRLYSLRVDPLAQLVYYGTFGGTIGAVGYDGSNPHVISNQPGLYAFAYEFGSGAIPEPATFVLCLLAAAFYADVLSRRR